MKALKIALVCGLTVLLAGCAITPCGYGCQSGYYGHPVYYSQAVYARPYYAQSFYVAGWHREHHHHGYY